MNAKDYHGIETILSEIKSYISDNDFEFAMGEAQVLREKLVTPHS